MTDFFVSYTQADQPWAEWIAWTLEEAGYKTQADDAVLEALIAKDNPLYLERVAAAEAEGEAKGMAGAILKVLEARGVAVSQAQREEILRCSDLARLSRWVARASLAASADEVTAEP